ncbi:MAG TPA: phosphoribosylamine--glycine ligase [Paenalcaligenes sp.]|nr:phosphoribosylamine--glycine ligase [Paenalcaligenes sp.]
MKLLVIGAGGREHAIAWRLTQSQRVTKVYVAPGNGGTASAKRMENVPLHTNEELVAFARDNDVAFAVVGPEAPLAAGIVDAFRQAGLRIVGPTQAAAQLESSKEYAKAFMERHQIDTAAYRSFTDLAAAKAYVDEQGAPIVIKADGLAAGKGVVVAETLEQAHEALDNMLGDGQFGQAGARVVIEEFLQGEEASFIVLCDGQNVLPMATSQDHKRLLTGDEGPNTGGMGAYSPAPIVSPTLHNRIMREIIYPTVQGMAREGVPYTGFLYAGLMIGEGPDSDRPIKLLEYNCRMGDPEAQPILLRLKSDLSEIFEQALEGELEDATIDWDRRPALGVVMASAGYPEEPRTGDVIQPLPADQEDSIIFHAATTLENEVLKTSGGRVLCVTALGESLRRAKETAYTTATQVHFDGKQFRSDIGWRALNSGQGN